MSRSIYSYSVRSLALLVDVTGNFIKLHELLNLQSARNRETKEQREKNDEAAREGVVRSKFGGAKLFNDSYLGSADEEIEV